MARRKKIRRVVLLSTQPLLGEALQSILSKFEEVELLGPWPPEADVLARLGEEAPDVVLLASDESDSLGPDSLTARLLARYPDFPLVQVSIEHSRVRAFTSRSLTAQSDDLIELIRGLPEKGGPL